MKRPVMRILDSLVPADIKEFEQSEELARARALVFLLLIQLALSVGGLIAGSVISFPASVANYQIRIGQAACIVSYLFAIGVFKRTGLYTVSGNVYALTHYLTILICVLTLPGPDSILFALLLLSMPLLVALIANYASGIVWLLIVAATPVAMHNFGNVGIGPIFLGTWTATCLGIFLAIYIGHTYRDGMSRRLNTERSKFEFAAAHDALTGLANRTTFDRRLRESIESCTLHGTKAVLAYIDLDKFKPINDTYGHQAGDIVLSTVADRLRRHVRGLDTVARLGGDEFAILFDQCNPTGVRPLIERIAAAIKEPIEVFDNSLVVTCSIGLVVCPDDGLHPQQLSHKADERMYEAKRQTNIYWTPTTPAPINNI